MPHKPRITDSSLKKYTKVMLDDEYWPDYQNWLEGGCLGIFHLYNKCVYFENEQDAIMFKLRF